MFEKCCYLYLISNVNGVKSDSMGLNFTFEDAEMFEKLYFLKPSLKYNKIIFSMSIKLFL